ncbi:hypothetical protein SESBI_05484 [Sesbania bispinosa]|nr:hypothetical protein SESBI_05484 [Sesbania bispinosa]
MTFKLPFPRHKAALLSSPPPPSPSQLPSSTNHRPPPPCFKTISGVLGWWVHKLFYGFVIWVGGWTLLFLRRWWLQFGTRQALADLGCYKLMNGGGFGCYGKKRRRETEVWGQSWTPWWSKCRRVVRGARAAVRWLHGDNGQDDSAMFNCSSLQQRGGASDQSRLSRRQPLPHQPQSSLVMPVAVAEGSLNETVGDCHTWS